MNEQQSPKGMISVEDFSKRKGIPKEKVIAMIKDGYYVGRIINEQWFVDPSEQSGHTGTSGKSEKVAYHSNYEVARAVAQFISFLGWIVFGIGIIAAVVILVDAQSRYGGGISILSMLPGFGIAISGVFLVAAGQVTRATVDNADHTREILNYIKEKG